MKFHFIELKNKYRIHELPVFFSSLNCLEVIEKVLDENGKILNFPGIVEDERWLSKHRIGMIQDVRFEAGFKYLENNKFLMTWMLQPDGMYWMDDDGFGITNDSCIVLYSFLDGTGHFLKKFELYSIDQKIYGDF